MGDATRGPRAQWCAVERWLMRASGGVERARARLRASTARVPDFLALLVGATAVWILLWAWYDFLILARAFPAAPGYHADLDVYWAATWWVVFPITTILIFRRHAWLPLLALAIGGWEDILFYWVQGHPVPAGMAYLPQTPTAGALFLRAGLFLAVALVAAVMMRLPAMRIRFVPLELVTTLVGILEGYWAFIASVPAYAAAKAILVYLARHRARTARPAR